MDRLQLTAVYCNRRRVQRQHFNGPVFAMQKGATIWLQMKLTITEYSLTTSAQLDYKILKESIVHLVLRLRGQTDRQDAQHQ